MKTTSLNSFSIGILASFIAIIPAGLYTLLLSWPGQGSIAPAFIYEGLFFIFGAWWVYEKEAKPIGLKTVFTHFGYYLLGYLVIPAGIFIYLLLLSFVQSLKYR